MKKYYMVMAPCGEGVIFDNEKDADFALTGENNDGGSIATLADTFHELYGEDNLSMQVIEL